jgi:hypothetical protein
MKSAINEVKKLVFKAIPTIDPELLNDICGDIEDTINNEIMKNERNAHILIDIAANAICHAVETRMLMATVLEFRPILIEGHHKHKCNNCGNMWEHSDDMAGNEEAHKCPNCREEQWTKYRGEDLLKKQKR